MSIHSLIIRPQIISVQSICNQCRFRLLQQICATRRFTTGSSKRETAPSTLRNPTQWHYEYFSANSELGKLYTSSGRRSSYQETVNIYKLTQSSSISPTDPSTTSESASEARPPSETSEPPRRRRKRLKQSQNASPQATFLPSNSASTLSTISSTLPRTSLRRLLTTCLSLSKPRLSFLIVLTTAASYSLYPVPTLLLPETTASPSLSAITLVFLTAGTGLCAASANALNMLMEPKYDAQMSRTRNRPLVRGLIGKKGALLFAALAGTLGVGGLYFGVNPTVAFLGGLNIALYAGVYTPIKRLSVLNTWVGALVGGIPPLMGWAAAAGQSATENGGWKELLLSENSVGGWLLAGLLFAWQFPHFNSLSWPIREEYKNAGYRMLAWTNASRNGRVALRYAVLCFPVCFGLWAWGITDQGFLLTSSLVNGWMVKEAWHFWRLEGYKGSARGLFWASVWHLPVIMGLAMIHKNGLWEMIWRRVSGSDKDGDELRLDERQPGIVYKYRLKPSTEGM